jgi:hypothetical protein
MKGIRSTAELWGAQAASLHRPAACRAEVQHTNVENDYRVHASLGVFSASCRKLQGRSLLSPAN